MSWTYLQKTASTFTNVVKNTTIWVLTSLLKREQGDYILLENGGRIVLAAGSDKAETTWTNQIKN